MLHRKMMSRKRYLAASLGSPGQWGVTATRARLLANVTAFMKRQPGQAHRAIGENPTYLNYAVWESTADFRTAFTHPEFQAKLSKYRSLAVASPHLFQKVAVPGICVA